MPIALKRNEPRPLKIRSSDIKTHTCLLLAACVFVFVLSLSSGLDRSLGFF